MSDQTTLNKLEHNLLSSTMNDVEPLYILYHDTMRDVEGASLDAILEALVKLTKIGLLNCFFRDDKTNVRRPCKKLTVAELKKHCVGRTEEQLRRYPEPEYGGEYEFEPTPEGRIE